MDWRYEVDLDWLKARRQVITATEIVALIPEIKRKRKSKSGSEELLPLFVALWAEKNSDQDPDPNSYGPAARGHILEPYAIKAYNKHCATPVFHWDDSIVARDGVGFSPDGLDCECINKVFWDLDIDGPLPGPIELVAEVKSYEPRQHLQRLIEPAEDMKERMQLAVAFHVMPTLTTGDIIFYCPPLNSVGMGMFVKSYTRESLRTELELVEEIIIEWKRTCTKMANMTKQMNTIYTENQIYGNYVNERGSLLS